MHPYVATLQGISGLVVRVTSQKKQNVFEFISNGIVVKGCYTYPKAKLYAQGVAFGRTIWLNEIVASASWSPKSPKMNGHAFDC